MEDINLGRYGHEQEDIARGLYTRENFGPEFVQEYLIEYNERRKRQSPHQVRTWEIAALVKTRLRNNRSNSN